MYRVLSTCIDAAIAAVILVPLFLILNQRRFHSNIRTCFYLLFSLYLCAMFAVVGLPDIRYVRFDPNYNLIPFRYMFSDFGNSFLNVVLFLPMGLFLPVFWSSYRKARRTVLFGFYVSLLIEFLQIFTFRATDINDLMTNTFGTLTGYFLAKVLLRFIPQIKPRENNGELYLICFSAFCVMFFAHPFLSEWIFLYC